ncbi:MAG TPA: phosphate signaling complex protein PhoU [Acidimicrobiales bacterium]|nr:phosphate signaling complex protein PhoU [Acidimicrobiales bacterium]
MEPAGTALHDDLAVIDQRVRRLFALVSEAIAAATEALLARDRDAAQVVIVDDAVLDDLQTDIEAVVERCLTLQQPFASDIRYLFTVLRIAPQLERCGDLAEHIAQRADPTLIGELPPSVRGRFARMGELAVDMWQVVGQAWLEADAAAGARLAADDDELDKVHGEVRAELAAGALPVADAVEMALVARFYERLGDHAVSIARRIELLSGRRPAHLDSD